MRKIFVSMLVLATTMSMMVTGCSSSTEDQGKVQNAVDGNVVELEGQQDQYGWFPHMRLTFDGNVLTEVYFDYVDDAGAKKSQDEEYNAGMKEKTGIDTKEAMIALREGLMSAQDPEKVDVVAGATQTSTEFIDMAKQAYEQYFNGANSANNYDKGDPTTTDDDTNTNTASDNNGTDTTNENGSNYENGGDGSPNAPENSANAPGAEGSGQSAEE